MLGMFGIRGIPAAGVPGNGRSVTSALAIGPPLCALVTVPLTVVWADASDAVKSTAMTVARKYLLIRPTPMSPPPCEATMNRFARPGLLQSHEAADSATRTVHRPW